MNKTRWKSAGFINVQGLWIGDPIHVFYGKKNNNTLGVFVDINGKFEVFYSTTNDDLVEQIMIPVITSEEAQKELGKSHKKHTVGTYGLDSGVLWLGSNDLDLSKIYKDIEDLPNKNSITYQEDLEDKKSIYIFGTGGDGSGNVYTLLSANDKILSILIDVNVSPEEEFVYATEKDKIMIRKKVFELNPDHLTRIFKNYGHLLQKKKINHHRRP